MEKIFNVLTMAMLAVLVSSCASYDDKSDVNDPGELNLIVCKEPRPQICTREYNPVCATYKDGTTKTGSTGCTSCSDSQVVGYVMGVC